MVKGSEIYAGGTIVTGRVSHGGQVKGNHADEKGYTVTAGWQLGVGLTTSHHKNVYVEKHLKMLRKGTEENPGIRNRI
jgi:hypothetical protein